MHAVEIVFPKSKAEKAEAARLYAEGKAASGEDDPFLRDVMNNRKCLREPIAEIYAASQILEDAVTAHLAGETQRATELFLAADMPVLRDWLESLWGVKSPYVMYRQVPGAEPSLSKLDRIGNRMPSGAEKRALLERDRHRCRFCGIPVVRAEVRKKLYALYPDAVRWDPSSNKTQHAAFQVMWAQYDHVLPHSRGGMSEVDNLVVACAGCNYARMQYTLAEVGLSDPRLREPESSEWDGLERIFG